MASGTRTSRPLLSLLCCLPLVLVLLVGSFRPGLPPPLGAMVLIVLVGGAVAAQMKSAGWLADCWLRWEMMMPPGGWHPRGNHRAPGGGPIVPRYVVPRVYTFLNLGRTCI